MRSGLLILGIIILIIGMSLFFINKDKVDDIESPDWTDLEDFPEDLSYYTDSSKYNNAKTMMNFGVILSIVGFVICLAGIFTSSKDGKKRCHLLILLVN